MISLIDVIVSLKYLSISIIIAFEYFWKVLGRIFSSSFAIWRVEESKII